MTGFDRFWQLWPSNSAGGYQRKGGKSQCLKIWTKNHNESQTETILKHIAWLKSTPDWLKNNGSFIPMPSTYLNQQRWDGAEVPETRSELSAVDFVRQQRAMVAAEDAKAVKPSPEARAKIAALLKRNVL